MRKLFVLLLPWITVILIGGCQQDAADSGMAVFAPRDSRNVEHGRFGPRVVHGRPKGELDYYVDIRPDINHERVADSLASLVHGQLGYVYQNFHAFTIHSISPGGLVKLAKLPEVIRVTKASFLSLATTQTLPTNGSLWHLDHIDQISGARDFRFNYFYPGNGVHIYIIDSGIDTSSGQFAGRVGNGVAFTQYPGDTPYDPTTSHGTGIAALAAATTYGVAKGAIIHSVRIMGIASFTDTDLNAGIDWIISSSAQYASQGRVVNVSLRTATALSRAAYQKLSDRQISLVKAAGNYSTDACADDYSNQGVPDEIVVSAIDSNNRRPAYADYGRCVTVFAPG